MRWFRNVRIQTKLIGAFVLVASIAVLVGFVGIRNMGTPNGMADFIHGKELIGGSLCKGGQCRLP